MKLLCRAEKKVKVSLQECVEVLVLHLGQCRILVPFCRFQAIPVERASLPVQHLEFAAFSG